MASAGNTFLQLSVVAFILSTSLVSAEGQCIKGEFHRPAPVAAANFEICQEYSNNTCCTKDFTDKLNQSRTEQLYNHTWDLCGAISKPCEKFWLQQECFYQCSPNVYKWKHPNAQMKDAIHGVPLCSSVCDGWFDACKDDKVCVQDVLTGYEFLANGSNRCPANSSCVTYKEMFKSGEGLCNKMWNTSYVYTTENADKSNCMVFAFNGSNPNDKVTKPTSPPPTTTPVGPTATAFLFQGSVAFTMLGLIVGLAVWM